MSLEYCIWPLDSEDEESECGDVPFVSCNTRLSGCSCESIEDKPKLGEDTWQKNEVVKYGEWRSVEGIDSSKLQVSSNGFVKVRISASARWENPKFKKPRRGYLAKIGCYTVCVNYKSYLVHRLVATAFLGSPPHPESTVDHIDRDPTNNRANNLRWSTPRLQRANQGIAKINRLAKGYILTSKDGISQTYETARQAAIAIGCYQGSISQAARSGCKARGYTVKFAAPSESQNDLEIDGVREQWKATSLDKSLRVSTMGRIQRKYPHGNGWGYKMTPKPNKRKAGYCYVAIGTSRIVIHRLILQTFVGHSKDPSADTVDHINRIRHDNRISNLRWATKSEQALNQTTSV